MTEGKTNMKINNRYAQFALYLIAFIAVWNLCGLIAATLIYHSSYHFDFVNDIVKPAGLGALIGLITYMLPGRKR